MATQIDAKSTYESSLQSFSGLIETLKAVGNTPSLDRLTFWLEAVEITEDELRPYLGFKKANYRRHLVCRNEFVEMLVLCWKPGHRTPIHDHNGSHGAVKVHQGILWETIFHYDADRGLCYRTARECLPGHITAAEVPDIHQLGNPDVSERDLITIHIYAPPLGVLRTYKAGSRQIDHYTPSDADFSD